MVFGPIDIKVYHSREPTPPLFMEGERLESMYVMSAEDAYIDKVMNNEIVNLWYARLGHVGDHKLKAMMQKYMVNGSP